MQILSQVKATQTRLRRMKQRPRVKIIRRALGLTQGSSPRVIAFPSTRCAIGRTARAEPDETACAELLVIAREPETVRKALEPRPLSKSAA